MNFPFVAVAGWSSHQAPPSTRSSLAGHSRSLSSVLSRSSSPAPMRGPAKSPSVSELPILTGDTVYVPSRPSTPQPKRTFVSRALDDAHDLTTLPDPRSRGLSPANVSVTSSPHHPDLDNEVATLSTKLINAINHQTTLDDTLSATRLELEGSRETIRQLEQQLEEQREMLAGDVWVRRKTVEAEKTTLLNRVAEERREKQAVEVQKKKIEQELENLTTALFEEANKMVISAKEEARAEQEALQRKNDQLKAQLADTEVLLRSQQEQLAELKQVMEQMRAERDDQTLATTVPSSPGFSKFDPREEDDRLEGIPPQGQPEPLSPSYPTSFTHLLQPVLRTDLAAFADFRDLIRSSKRLSGQRVSLGSSLGLGLGGSTCSQSATISSASYTMFASPPTQSLHTPPTPASSAASPGSAPTQFSLKDTRFYKRALTEDMEPTLRLDMAPGLSWLARRSVLTAMSDGALVVEPVPPTRSSLFGKTMRPELQPCSLCGEARTEDEHLRRHCFRTSDSGSSQRGYALCSYCLVRVRSTCDFLGFLRMIKDGHWRADDEEAEKAAWEESVRLREQMFWSRIGGGVLPVSHPHHASSSSAPSVGGDKSPRPSHEALPDVGLDETHECATTDPEGVPGEAGSDEAGSDEAGSDEAGSDEAGREGSDPEQAEPAEAETRPEDGVEAPRSSTPVVESEGEEDDSLEHDTTDPATPSPATDRTSTETNLTFRSSLS